MAYKTKNLLFVRRFFVHVNELITPKFLRGEFDTFAGLHQIGGLS